MSTSPQSSARQQQLVRSSQQQTIFALVHSPSLIKLVPAVSHWLGVLLSKIKDR